MIERIKKFFRACTAKVTDTDILYVKKHLSEKARTLFFNMSVADQYHALHVAYTAAEIVKSNNTPCNIELLCRVSLLHDIGRVKGSMNVFEKSIAVLFFAFFPVTAKKMSLTTTGWLTGILHTYVFHPKIGAAMLESIDMHQEASIICRHHESKTPKDSTELNILRIADSKN